MKCPTQYLGAPVLALFITITAVGGCAHLPAKEVLAAQRFSEDKEAAVQIRQVFKKGVVLGTGVVVDARGYVVTNHHVVAPHKTDGKTPEQGRMEVCVRTKGCLPASIVADTDETIDLALLKVDMTFDRAPKVRTDHDLKDGEEVIAYGNIGGLLPPTAVRGRYLGRVDKAYAKVDTPSFLFDMMVVPGMSGGPIFDADGNIVAITMAYPDLPGRPPLMAVPGEILAAFLAKALPPAPVPSP